MFDFFKNFKTKLSTQFGLLTSLLIAIMVLCIAGYSIMFVDSLTSQVTSQTRKLNESINITVLQVVSDYIDKNNYAMIDKSVRNMVNNNLIASLTIKETKTNKIIYKSPEVKVKEKTLERKRNASFFSKKEKHAFDKKTYSIAGVKDDKTITAFYYSEPIVKEGLDILIENMSAMVIIFIFLGFILSNFVAKVLIKPINMLVRSLVEAKGDFSHRLEATSYLEINRLIVSYNNMAASLEELYQSMEQQVKDRTKELESAYTELKSTQAMMVHSEKMKSLGELVAGITHEINNPVNFIYGNLIHLNNYTKELMSVIEKYSEFNDDLTDEHRKAIAQLKEDIDLDFLKDDLPDLIRSCQEGTERTKNIILDLKNFSRLEEAVINNVNLPKEIDTTLNILHNKFKNKITVHKEYSENIPMVEGYGGQLNQVFMNILDNAAFAIKDKGDVWIRIKEEENQVVIEFEDNGCGMEEKDRKKVFDPFFTTKPVGQGTGLGMAISYKVIKNHQGNIELESEPGKGTKFTLTLPLNMKTTEVVA